MLIDVQDSGSFHINCLNFTFQCTSPEKELSYLSNDTFGRDDALNSSTEILRRKNTSTETIAAKKKRNLRQILGNEFLTNCQNFIVNQSIFRKEENISPRSNKHEEPKSHMLETESCKKELGKKCQEMGSNNSEQNKEDDVHHTEEKLNKGTSESGFVSSKIRSNLHGHREKESKNRGNFNEGNDPGGFRRPLRDKTNHVDKGRDDGFRGTLMNKFDISVDAVMTEDLSSGKWQCPRKRKPYVSPPLKQLRLERWVSLAS
jgi:hypothetical protein